MTSASLVGFLDLQASSDDARPDPADYLASISVLIGVLVIVVVGANVFGPSKSLPTIGRLANLLKLLVVLVCLGAQRSNDCSP